MVRPRGLTLVTLLALAACRCPGAQPAADFTPPTDSMLLPIADRPSDPHAPVEGWCAEASIQMVALYYGAFFPQAAINKAGKPKRGPDLWEDEVPGALSELGLQYIEWKAPARDAGQGIGDFTSWIVSQVRERRPVIVGAKLFPSEHPDWDVDHIMPVVGFAPDHLVFNTNSRSGQRPRTWESLSQKQGISFASASGRLYGFAIEGFRGEPGALPVSLRVAAESPAEVELEVQVSGLAPGRRYRLVREGGGGTEAAREFTASASVESLREKVPPEASVRFRAR